MITEAIIAALLVIGAFFTLVGSIGLIKLDNCMSRLHGPTKASTLGVGALLLASVVYSFNTADGSVHHVVVNGDMDVAFTQLQSIILKLFPSLSA